MAKVRINRGNQLIEIEISDLALVATVMGIAAALVTGTWLVTRNPNTLRQLARIAEQKGARLVQRGIPLLADGQ